MPKLGHIAVMQADIVVASLLNEVGQKVKNPEFKPEVLCIMNMGH
jgi:sulfide:quinone oxidoreductase